MTRRVVLSSHRFEATDDNPGECRHCGRRPDTHPETLDITQLETTR
jgi:hypothetical protein